MKSKISVLFCLGFMSVSTFAHAIFNIAYVEVNSNPMSNVACYLNAETKKPFFTMASIFGANINGTDPNHPEIHLNPGIEDMMAHTTQVKDLQSKGIRVLISLLGNHQNAGWSCMTEDSAAQIFANHIVEMVNKYHLDGVDIDDEYSEYCQANDTSLIMIAENIKKNPQFQGKILTKALWSDSDYFLANYHGVKLADLLDYGFEMTYGNSFFESRASFYLENGMTKDKLSLGGWTKNSYVSSQDLGHYLKENNYGGGMIYDVDSFSWDYLNHFSQGETGVGVTLEENCLR